MVFLRMTLFSLLVIGLFALFSIYYIPPMSPAPPPVEETLDFSKITMDQFVEFGEKVYNGKGTCTLCHKKAGNRAPLLDSAATVALQRIKDPRYKGKARDAASYIEESMRDPSAYVVSGYGVKGTNDTVSPMPEVTTGEIGLNDAEVKAVVAYLQKLGGVDITVEIPRTQPKPVEKPAEGAVMGAIAKTPEDAIKKFGCRSCHKVGGTGRPVAPDLTHIGLTRDRDYLRRAILDPNAELAAGYPAGLMPRNYGSRMTAGELELIVDYLAKSK